MKALEYSDFLISTDEFNYSYYLLKSNIITLLLKRKGFIFDKFNRQVSIYSVRFKNKLVTEMLSYIESYGESDSIKIDFR